MSPTAARPFRPGAPPRVPAPALRRLRSLVPSSSHEGPTATPVRGRRPPPATTAAPGTATRVRGLPEEGNNSEEGAPHDRPHPPGTTPRTTHHTTHRTAPH
ncbi:hypothetical protein GCM10009864_49990 [Streptomyces lunalinharesii]|uniref:Uncharacterized protein n=1 Tax=Streptomyces lunalinharesii TaxID=333384 RepID=A0ABP6EQY0_9ACTN